VTNGAVESVSAQVQIPQRRELRVSAAAELSAQVLRRSAARTERKSRIAAKMP